MKRFAYFASFALVALLAIFSTIHAQSPPVYQLFEQSEQFDGNRCESFEDTQNLFSDSFTISTYVNVSNSEGRHPFVAHQSATERGFWLGLDAGKLYVEAYENEDLGKSIYADEPFPINQWVFVVVKYDALNNAIQLEQDGQVVRTKAGITTIRVNDQPVDLGCYIAVKTNPQFHYYLTGKMQGTRFHIGADLSVAQPAPNDSPVNPTIQPTADGSNPSPTPAPSDKGGNSNADFEFFVSAPQTFEGNRCIDVTNTQNIFGGNFTINTQIYLTQDNERHIILSQEREGDRGLVFDIVNGKPGLQLYSSSVDKTTIDGNKDVALNTWTELTATFDNGTVTIQMNGEEIGRAENVPPMRETSAPTQIGCYLFNDLNRTYLVGEMQKLFLFDNATTILPSITPLPTPTPDPNASPTPTGDGDYNEHVGSPGTYSGSCQTLEGTASLFANDWTFSAWVRPLEEQERHPIMTKQGEQERGVVVEIFQGKLAVELWTDGTTVAELESDTNVPVGQWTHIAVVLEGGTLSLWVNGVEAAAQSNVGTVASNEQAIHLACYEWDEDNQWYLFGQLQDVAITDSAADIDRGNAPSNELPPQPTPVYEQFPNVTQIFDGSTTCTEIDDNQDIFAGNWTAEFQFRMTQTQGRQPIFSDEQNGSRGLLFSVEENQEDPSKKELVLQVYSDNFSSIEVIGDVDIPVGEWIHTAVSYNNGNVRIYVNGELVANESNIAAAQHPNRAPLRVGCYIYDSENSSYFSGELTNARFYAQATTVQTPTTTPIPPTDSAGPAPLPAGYERGRVKIVGGNLVTENGRPLRGEHIVFANGISPGEEDSNGWSQELMYDKAQWRVIRDTYKLNTVRLMLSRPPQNWFDGPGNNCSPPTYRCYSLDYVHPNGKTTLAIMDDLVKIAGELGMYIIIDYHPVLGHDKGDARLWWGRVAPRYKDHTHVIYELINEPWSEPAYPSDLIEFEQELYKQVRAIAPQTHIIVWSFANNRSDIGIPVGQAQDIDYINASVGFHPYEWPDTGSELETMKESITTLRQSYPIIATEIGGDRKARVRDMEAMGISWIGLDNIRGLPGLEDEAKYPDVYGVDEVFWDADPDAVDKVNDTNRAPTLGPLSNQTSQTGDLVSIQIPASDADGNVLRFTAVGLPAGLKLDSNSGRISGRIFGRVGIYTVNISVSDGTEVTSGSFEWVVTQGPMYIPMVASVPLQ